MVEAEVIGMKEKESKTASHLWFLIML